MILNNKFRCIGDYLFISYTNIQTLFLICKYFSLFKMSKNKNKTTILFVYKTIYVYICSVKKIDMNKLELSLGTVYPTHPNKAFENLSSLFKNFFKYYYVNVTLIKLSERFADEQLVKVTLLECENDVITGIFTVSIIEVDNLYYVLTIDSNTNFVNYLSSDFKFKRNANEIVAFNPDFEITFFEVE